MRPGAGAGGAGAAGENAGQTGTYFARTDALDAQGAALRAGAAGYPDYSPAALAGNANAWHPTNVVSQSLYTYPGYSSLARGLGLPAQPVAYDYGGNVVAQTDAVYVNGDAAGTPQEYAQQAGQIAALGQSAQPSADSKWLPLGVFAIVEGDATQSDDIFQIAVNPQGVIRGNYHNLRTDTIESISGSVDKKSQRAAWTISTDQAPVYEAGIANLTRAATPIFVHNADGQSHQMSLIRLPQPEQPASSASAAKQ